MSDLLNRIKKSIEEGMDVAKANAQGLKEMAEEYGKTAKLKYDIFQLENSKKRKMELLGETVFPFLVENNTAGLKKHETLIYLLDSIKNIDNQIELNQKALQDITEGDTEDARRQERDDLRNQINEIEKDIEEKIKALKIVKESID